MKKYIETVCIFAMTVLLTACSQAANTSVVQSTAGSTSEASASTTKRVASDGAEMQKDDPSLPTRKLPQNGTKINLYFGDVIVPGVLNNSDTAKALVAELPVTLSMNRYAHDFCGQAGSLHLPYQEDEVHYGWLNGDIDYAIDEPWFTVLFDDEAESEQFGSQVNIGVMNCPLETIRSLQGSYDVRIELAS